MSGLAIAAMALIGLAVFGLGKLSHASGQLATQVNGRIFSVEFNKITFAIDTIIKNPTNTEVTVSYPFIKLMKGTTILASSDLKNSTINIKPYAQTSINNIQIPITFLQMGSLAPEIFKRVKDKNSKIKFQAVVSTQVSFAGTTIPYSYKQDVII